VRFWSASVVRSSNGRIAPVNTTGTGGTPSASVASPLRASRSVPCTTTTPSWVRASRCAVSAISA
jgi:hypothetical protein